MLIDADEAVYKSQGSVLSLLSCPSWVEDWVLLLCHDDELVLEKY